MLCMNATLKRFIQERNSIKSIFRGAKNSRVSIRETKCSCRILTLKFHEEIFTKVTSPLGSRASPRWGSSPHARTTSPRTTYRSRRLFYKSHLSLILSRLLSKPDPLSLGSGLGPPLRGGFVLSQENIDFNRLFQKGRHGLWSCLPFWVPAAEGGLHPSVIQMLGGSEFRLRRGFACGKTLVRRKSAAGRMAGRAILPQRSRRSKIDIFW